MAVASTRTLIPLDRAAQILGFSLIPFNGVQTAVYGIESFKGPCHPVWLQWGWQTADRYSREELALDLAEAEQIVASHLGYWPLPQWIVGEEQVLPQPGRPEVTNVYNTRGMRKSIHTQWGYVTDVGVRAVTAIETDAAVTYSDPDGDGFDELATVVVATSVTDDEEIRVFYPGESADDTWEIRPITVQVGVPAAGQVTITFQKVQAVLPDLIGELPYPGDPIDAVDGDDNTNFLTTVDVYRVYVDTSDQVTFYMEPTNCINCDLTTQTGCSFIRDSRRGILTYWPATWDADTSSYVSASLTTTPLRITLNYRAGWQNQRLAQPLLKMDPALERMLVYYALSRTDKEICGCDNFSSHLRYKLEDLAKGREFQVTFNKIDCPLGTTRAALDLWEYILLHRLGTSQRRF